MKPIYNYLLNEIWYAKISPLGVFNNGMEIVMFPENETIPFFTFNIQEFEKELKEHIERVHNLNLICFPKTCWNLKGKPKPFWMKEWLSFTPKIRTDTKIGEGGHYNLPLNLLKNKPKETKSQKVEIKPQKPDWWEKWTQSRSFKRKHRK